MKSTMRMVMILLISLMFSSCIISSSPEGNSLSLSESQYQLFLVAAAKPAFPSNSSLHYNWFIDGVWKTENPSIFYSPSASDIGNTVTILCRVTVTNDNNGVITSSDDRKWQVTVTP